MKTKCGWALCAVAALVITTPGLAQDAERGDRQDQRAETARAASAADQACEKPKKKKKGLGLGGALRTVRSSGLLGAVAGRAGADGYLVNSAANAAIDISAAEADQRRADSAREVQSC